MKSYNHLYEKFISYENIYLAMEKACKFKSGKESFDSFRNNPDDNLEVVKRYAENFKNMEHSPKIIIDGITKKVRTIIRPYPGEQIIHHMTVNILEPIFMKSMYKHSYGSIPGRGGTLGAKYMKRWLRDRENSKYCLKMDIRHYFESIPHDILISKLRRIIHDEKFMSILEELVDATDRGIPLGFYTSQWIANWYLTGLDHYIKEELHAKYYIRYMDDMVILGNGKQDLHDIRKGISEYISSLGLELKENWQIFPVDLRPIDFLGYRFYHNRVTLRRGILLRACRKAKRIYDKGEKPPIYMLKQVMSYMGWFSFTDTYNAYLEYFKIYVDINKAKRRISIYDRRLAGVSG